MPLSEQEQRVLDEMERSLYHGDADFVTSVGGRRVVGYTAMVGGVLLALAGVGVLVLGVWTHLTVVGVLGFVAMFGGVLLAMGSPGRSAAPDGRARFMDRLSSRWERRRRA